jgi:uncharacterized protein YjbI with pentapeptide repeats
MMSRQQSIDRWRSEPLLTESRSIVLQLIVPPDNLVQREWYQNRALKVSHPYDNSCLDLAGGDFSHLEIGEIWLSGCSLRFSNFECSNFSETNFQSSLLEQANFSHCNIHRAQMLPIFASRCDFSYSVISSSTFENFGPAEKGKGYYSELMHTNFSYCKVSKSSFSWCDFSHANLAHVQFTECRFDRADMSCVNFEGAQFIDCDFANTSLDDTPLIRHLVNQGNNRNLHKIQWQTLKA